APTAPTNGRRPRSSCPAVARASSCSGAVGCWASTWSPASCRRPWSNATSSSRNELSSRSPPAAEQQVRVEESACCQADGELDRERCLRGRDVALDRARDHEQGRQAEQEGEGPPGGDPERVRTLAV